jgi:GNAT superfamily N-acetyltransferase
VENEPLASNVVIRSAIAADGHAIVAFNIAIAKEVLGMVLDIDRLSRGVWAVLLDPFKGMYYVAEREGKIIGQLLVTYEWSDWRNGVYWWLQSIYVAPEQRRSGVLRALTDFVIKEAQRRPDVCGVRSYIANESPVAKMAHENLGFKRAPNEMFERIFSRCAI